MSSCSRIAQALLQSDQEMPALIAELHDLRRRVREAEVRARARWQYKSSTRPRRRRGFIAFKFVRTLSTATIGARHLDGPVPVKFDSLEQPALW